MSRNRAAASGITDLDVLVKTWASETGGRMGIKDAKKARTEVIWDRVRFTPGVPDWKELASGVPQPHSNRIVYASSFENRTPVEAKHTLKVEKRSRATVCTAVTNGYSTSVGLGLSLALPNDVVSATADFGKTVVLETAESSTKEHEQVWAVDSEVPSPPMSRTLARVEVKEKRWTGSFSLPVIINGTIVINFYDDNNRFLGVLEEDARNLLSRHGGEVTQQGSNVTWTLRGNGSFEYGVEQITVVEHESLEVQEPAYGYFPRF